MNDATRLASIGQIAISVGDLARATVFYRDTLGLPFLFGAGHLAFFDCGGVRLMLDGNPESASTPLLYFRCGDIHATTALLRGRGVAFEAAPHLIAKMPDHELWMAFFRDSEGNLQALMNEVR